MNFSFALRVLATLFFLLALFGVAPFGLSPVALGLACWCGSTLA